MVVIRPSQDHDALGLSSCVDAVARERNYLATVQGFSVEQTRSFIASFAGSQGIQLVAVEGAEVVGWGDISQVPHVGMEHVGRLGMGCLRSHRGQGLGSRLLDELLRHASGNGLRRVELEVFASNSVAIRLYETRGFSVEGRKRKARILDGLEDDIVLMALCR